jgi:hypothetical protein
MSHQSDPSRIYGLLAEFVHAEEAVEAATRAHAEGYRKLDAYSPYPVDGLAEACGFTTNRVALITLIGGITGGAGGFFMQWFSAVVHYPINVGGRPFNSWPAFIPITFEMTILFATLFGLFGMLMLNGLPRLYHPVFHVPRFELASRSRFFLCVQATDPKFDAVETRRFLESLHPHAVDVVPC